MDQNLLNSAILGQDADDFLKSHVGRYMLKQCDEIIQNNLNDLVAVLPWRRRRITELQNNILCAKRFKTWMAEMIITGKQAERVLDESEA